MLDNAHIAFLFLCSFFFHQLILCRAAILALAGLAAGFHHRPARRALKDCH